MTLWFYNLYLKLIGKLSGSAKVRGYAAVSDNAKVCGHAHIYGYVSVCCHSILEGDINISKGRIIDIHWWKDIP